MNGNDKQADRFAITERTYYPADPDDDPTGELHSFMVKVQWRGRGKYAVTRGGRYEYMTHTGKWLFCPLMMTQMRWCRFSFEDADRLAQEAVKTIKVNGRTWSEWQAFWNGETT